MRVHPLVHSAEVVRTVAAFWVLLWRDFALVLPLVPVPLLPPALRRRLLLVPVVIAADSFYRKSCSGVGPAAATAVGHGGHAPAVRGHGGPRCYRWVMMCQNRRVLLRDRFEDC